MNTTPRYYPSQPALADLGRVPGPVAAVFEYLKALPRNRVECWESAKTISVKLDMAPRTVQAAIEHLTKAGLVAYRTDYALKTRRAIVMLWRVEDKNSAKIQDALKRIDAAIMASNVAAAKTGGR